MQRQREQENESQCSAEASLDETYRSLTPWGRSTRPHPLAAESQANREGKAESESESDSRRAGLLKAFWGSRSLSKMGKHSSLQAALC